MIALLRSELLRARSRRVVTMAVIGLIIGTTVAILIGFFTAEQPTAEQIARGQRQYEQNLEICLEESAGQELPPEFDTVEEACAAYIGTPADYGPSELSFAELPNLLTNVSTILILVGAVLGTTLGGADWSTATMTTLLTWEPRRIRVLVARAVAVSVVVVVVMAIGMAVIALEFAALAALRGSLDGLPSGFGGDVLAEILRIAALSAVYALIGLALATIGRSTVAGLGILLGYLVVVEGVITGFVFWVQRITLIRSSLVIVSDSTMELYDPSLPDPEPYLLTPGRAWITLGAWVVVLLIGAGVTFRVRDVT